MDINWLNNNNNSYKTGPKSKERSEDGIINGNHVKQEENFQVPIIQKIIFILFYFFEL